MAFHRPSPSDSTLTFTFVSDRADVDRLIHGFELRPYDVVEGRYLRSQQEVDRLVWRNDTKLFWSTAPRENISFTLQMTYWTGRSEIELVFDHGNEAIGDSRGAFLGSLGRGDMTTFMTILESGIDLHAPDVSGSSVGIEALGLAYRRGEMALVRRLLDLGIPPCDPVGLGGNALVEPARNGDVATLRMLLGWYPEWNGPCTRAPARMAASRGDVEILDVLMDHGLDIDGLTPSWGTPGRPFDPDHPAAANCARTLLMEAAHRGHLECVEYLIAHGARVDVVTECSEKFSTSRWTAVELAEVRGHHEIVRVLEEALADGR